MPIYEYRYEDCKRRLLPAPAAARGARA